MISLFGASDVLRVVTNSAATLNVVANYATRAANGTVSKGRQRTVVSAVTTTTVCDAPSAGEERTVYSLVIRNTHASLANTVTVQEFDGTTAYERFRVVLAAGEQLIFDGLGGWQYLNAQGMLKISESQGSSAAALSATNMVVLGADVVNANAVANTMQDITGLSFPVVAGETYQFEFTISYLAAATTTGARFSINGPAFSLLAYQSMWSLTQTSLTQGNYAAYDLPTAANASSANTTGNIAFLLGEITAAVDGNVIARFASEVASSAITAKAGSLLKWARTR